MTNPASALPPAIPPDPEVRGPEQRAGVFSRFLKQARVVFVVVATGVFLVCLGFWWSTRDAMENLPTLNGAEPAEQSSVQQKMPVDLRPAQTASLLATMAVSNEEAEFAQKAERLANHEVDEAFKAALAKSSARMLQLTATDGAVRKDSERVAGLEQLVKEDQARLTKLKNAEGAPGADATEDPNGEIANAQLQLDIASDDLSDAQQDLVQSSKTDQGQIQQELTDFEAAMKKSESEARVKGLTEVAAAERNVTLWSLIEAWGRLFEKKKQLHKAQEFARSDANGLTRERDDLQHPVKVAADADRDQAAQTGPAAGDGTGNSDQAKSTNLRERNADERELLKIDRDRILTEKLLLTVYGNWLEQVKRQHRMLLHLTLQSVGLIALIVVCVVVVDSVLVPLIERPTMDYRRTETLRKISQLAVRVMGGLLVLLVVFGQPQQMATLVGLLTAGLAVVLQDFIIAFFGWFVLMGKNGIRVGDWVEIDGVGGEVSEIGLFRTTLLETGNWTDKGHPTGRRVTFINSFAIRGQFFNFSTTGQWMWDEISVNVPAGEDAYAMVENIHKAVVEETARDARAAEVEWRRGSRSDGLSQFAAEARVNLRPSAAGIEVLVRYVTRASYRFEMRNRIFQRVLDVLRGPGGESEGILTKPVGTSGT